MKTTDQEIQEVLKKNLPAHVGEVLKERLEQAEKDSALVETLRAQLQKANDLVANQSKELEEHVNLDKRNEEIISREKEIQEKEIKHEIETLKVQLEAEKYSKDFMNSVTMGLIRNTQYRKTIFDSENQAPYQSTDGNWIYPTPSNKQHTETASEE